jgi:hypothetical protein
MASSKDSRYDDILRRLQQRQREQADAPKQDDLAAILDGVNAWGFLDEVKQAKLGQMSCYGPKIFRGYTPILWVGVVVWCKPRGYYHYQMLTLLGLWAYERSGVPSLMLGMKTLEYSAPIFTPESYHYHIKRRFDLHYKGDASPPPESAGQYTVQYDASRRLEIRRAIERELAQWAAAYR